MATYPYSLILRGEYEKNVGTVQYSISPDYGQPIAPGDTVTITGEVRCTSLALRCIGFRYFAPDATAYWEVIEQEVKLKLDKGKTGKFTIAFQIPSSLYDGMSARIMQSPTGDHFDVCFYVSDKAPGVWSANYTYTDDETHRLTFLQYRLNPHVAALTFLRANSLGNLDDGGNRVLCQSLRIDKSALAVDSDVTVVRFTYGIEDGAQTTKNLAYNHPAIMAALGSGYADSTLAGSLFEDVTFWPTNTYTITLTVGDQFDQVSATFTVPRAFANMHLSGARNGGVSFGQYSSADDTHPKLESHYPAYMYAGIYGVTNYQSGEVETGGTWIDGKPIYRYVWAGTATGNSNTVLVTMPVTVGVLIGIQGSLATGTTLYNLPHAARGSDTYNAVLYLAAATTGGTELHLSTGSSITGTVNVVAVVDYTKA